MGIPCQNVKQDSLFGVTLKFLRLFFAGLIAIEVQKFLSGRLSRQYFGILFTRHFQICEEASNASGKAHKR